MTEPHVSEPFTDASYIGADEDTLGQARMFFTPKQIAILDTPWAMSRLQQLQDTGNKDKFRLGILGAFTGTSVHSLNDIVESYRTEREAGREFLAGPSASAAMDVSFMVEQVLEEGANKSPEELQVPVVRIVARTDEAVLDSVAWKALQRAISDHNAANPGDQIKVTDMDNLEGLLLIAGTFKDMGMDADDALKKRKPGDPVYQALIVQSIVDKILGNRSKQPVPAGIGSPANDT